MEAVSLSFLFLFLPVVFLGYILFRPIFSNIWLLLAGFFLIGLAAPKALPLLLAVILIAWLAGIGNRKIRNTAGKRILSGICIFLLAAVLLLIRISLLPGISWPEIVASVGAFFYILQAIMYIADTCRGESCLYNPLDLALYLSFFPKLVSGPLVPYRQFRERLPAEYRTPRMTDVAEGVWRIAGGLCKKILIADKLSDLVGLVFDMNGAGQMSVLQTWLGVAAYAVQLYLDFSAYSDIAVGIGKLFGYELPENFRYPYAAGSLKEFWRRWHISLSRFFRDYVYIPLGGNRKGTVRWIFSLAAVWLLTAVWHGLSWNYLIWGLGHAVLLAAETVLAKRKQGKTEPGIFGHVYTLLAVGLLWIFFRAGTPAEAWKILLRLFGVGAGSFADAGFLFQLKNAAAALLLGVVVCIPKEDIRWFGRIREKTWYQTASVIVLTAGVILSVATIYMNSYQPFLYAMF